MKDVSVILVIGILVLFGLLETLFGYLRNSKRKRSDWLQEVISFFALSTLIKPAIVAAVFLIGRQLAPESGTLLTGVNFFVLLVGYLLIDDLLQYWYHRKAHETPFLWKLHRTHHQAEEMGFFVSYRNAALYYLLMPNIWWVGLITFLGGGVAVATGLVLKQAIIIGSHSTVKWDAPFYRHKALRPVISVLRRIVITPAFHHSHHGRSKVDSVSDPNGNFGNMFSIWDQAFGSATFTDRYPTDYGLQSDTQDKWTAAWLYPFVKSDKEGSVLHSAHAHEDTTTKEPLAIELTKGEKYLWCRCGRSNTQPFCDGSHHGTKHTPLLFEAKRDGAVRLCNCKATKAGPFCDDSHLG